MKTIQQNHLIKSDLHKEMDDIVFVNYIRDTTWDRESEDLGWYINILYKKDNEFFWKGSWIESDCDSGCNPVRNLINDIYDKVEICKYGTWGVCVNRKYLQKFSIKNGQVVFCDEYTFKYTLDDDIDSVFEYIFHHK